MATFSNFRSRLILGLTPTNGPISEFSNKLVDEYIKELTLPGVGDTVCIPPNQIATYNRPALVAGLNALFNNSLNNNVPMDFTLLHPGLIAFWTGATLKTTGIPPGTLSTVSAVVSNPGVVPPPLPIPGPTQSKEPFADLFTNYFKLHLQTVQILITALVPGSPPTPATFPALYA